MKILAWICMGLVLLLAHRVGHAQAYPCSGASIGEVIVGQTQSSNGIASVPLCQRTPASAPSQDPTYTWKSRWGAIATDAPNAIIGTATNMKSQRAAEKAALNDCKSKGGSPCILEMPYMDSCVALTASDTSYNVASYPQISQAMQSGMDTCIKAGAENCHTFYTACSTPILVK